MNFNDWYTDTVDVYRTTDTTVNNLTKKTRSVIYSGIPCRVYTDSPAVPNMNQSAAEVKQSSKLAMSNEWDIEAGDELIVHRGGGLGKAGFDSRCFAGDPHHHFEPFGAVMPQLAHQEILMLQEERI